MTASAPIRRPPSAALLLALVLSAAACSLPRAGSRPCRITLATAPERGAVAYLVPWTDWRAAVGDGSLHDALAARPDFLQPFRVHGSLTPLEAVRHPYSFVFVAEKDGRLVHGERFTVSDGARITLALGGT